MPNYCAKCGKTEVANCNDICELCQIGEDPYSIAAAAQSASCSSGSPIGGSSVLSSPKRARIYSNSESDDSQPTVKNKRKILIGDSSSVADCSDQQPEIKVYQPGTAPIRAQNISAPAASQPVTSAAQVPAPAAEGIVKNIAVDKDKSGKVTRWFRALFSGIPYNINKEITMFQVFPDYTGTSLTMSGNFCDQVAVYGTITAGAVSEGNHVTVFGGRDSANNIIAKRIVNSASGTVLTPKRILSPYAVWLISLSVLAVIAYIVIQIRDFALREIATVSSAAPAIGSMILKILIIFVVVWLVLKLIKLWITNKFRRK